MFLFKKENTICKLIAPLLLALLIPCYGIAAPSPTTYTFSGVTSGVDVDTTIIDINSSGNTFVQSSSPSIYLTEITNGSTAERAVVFTSSSSLISPKTNIHLSDNGAVIFFASQGTSLESSAVVASLSTAGLVSASSTDAVYMMTTPGFDSAAANKLTKISDTIGLPSPDGGIYVFIGSGGVIYNINLTSGTNFGTVTDISATLSASDLATLGTNLKILAISKDNSNIVVDAGSSNLFSINITSNTSSNLGTVFTGINLDSSVSTTTVDSWPNLASNTLLHFNSSAISSLSLSTNNDQELVSTLKIHADTLPNLRTTTLVVNGEGTIIAPTGALSSNYTLIFFDSTGNLVDEALVDISGSFSLGNPVISHDGSIVLIVRQAALSDAQHIFAIELDGGSGGAGLNGGTSSTSPEAVEALDPIENAVAINQSTPTQKASSGLLFCFSLFALYLILGGKNTSKAILSCNEP